MKKDKIIKQISIYWKKNKYMYMRICIYVCIYMLFWLIKSNFIISYFSCICWKR